jgi:hypothetical protein
LNGVKAYIATPEVDYPKDKVLLYLTDVWGFERINAKVQMNSVLSAFITFRRFLDDSFSPMTLLAMVSRLSPQIISTLTLTTQKLRGPKLGLMSGSRLMNVMLHALLLTKSFPL